MVIELAVPAALARYLDHQSVHADGLGELKP